MYVSWLLNSLISFSNFYELFGYLVLKNLLHFFSIQFSVFFLLMQKFFYISLNVDTGITSFFSNRVICYFSILVVIWPIFQKFSPIISSKSCLPYYLTCSSLGFQLQIKWTLLFLFYRLENIFYKWPENFRFVGHIGVCKKSKMFSKVAEPFCISTSNDWEILLFYKLVSI